MAYTAEDNARRLAHMIDDTDLGVRSYPRGTRQIGDPCRLKIVINDQPVLDFEEHAGDRAPSELIVDITARTHVAAMLQQGLATRPWINSDSPVIVCAGPNEGQGICYLIRTREVAELIDLVRDGLDIDGGTVIPAAQVRLDAASGGG